MKLYLPSFIISHKMPWTKVLTKSFRVVLGPTWGYLERKPLIARIDDRLEK